MILYHPERRSTAIMIFSEFESFTKSGTGHYVSISDFDCIIRLIILLFFKLGLVSFSHNMSNELLLCKHKHFKHQNKCEAIMYPSLVEYMYNHGAHLSFVIVFYMITFNVPLVYYFIIVYYHIILIIRLFMNRTCSHYIISEWGMVHAIGLQILYGLIDHRVKIGYNYSSTWGNYSF